MISADLLAAVVWIAVTAAAVTPVVLVALLVKDIRESRLW